MSIEVCQAFYTFAAANMSGLEKLFFMDACTWILGTGMSNLAPQQLKAASPTLVGVGHSKLFEWCDEYYSTPDVQTQLVDRYTYDGTSTYLRNTSFVNLSASYLPGFVMFCNPAVIMLYRAAAPQHVTKMFEKRDVGDAILQAVSANFVEDTLGFWNSVPTGAVWLGRVLSRRSITWDTVKTTLGTEKLMTNQWEQGSGDEFVFKLHPQTLIANTRCLMSARLPSQVQADAAKENMPTVDTVWMGDVQYPQKIVFTCSRCCS